MKHIKKTALALTCLAMTAMAQYTMAADHGTIDFTGEVTDNTCTVSVNGGNADATIALPRVSTTALANNGDVTGRVFVRMNLTACGLANGGPATATSVHAFWQAAPNINVNGRLTNQATSGAATNVEIQMLNSTLGVIDLAKADNAQNTTTATITGGTAELTHYAQYFATAQSTPGAVASKLEYVLSYN